jgi:hypothetical protein
MAPTYPLAYGGQQYAERRQGSPKVTVTPDGVSRGSRYLWVPWGEQQNAAKVFLGYAEHLGVSGITLAGYISYHDPLPLAHWPAGFLYADSFGEIEGDLPDGTDVNQVGAFDEAKIPVNFKSPVNGYAYVDDATVTTPITDTNPDGTPVYNRGVPNEFYCIRRMEFVEKFRARNQTLPPNSGLRWWFGGADAGPASAAAFITLHESEITLTWYPVPLTAWSRIGFDGLVGRTNKYPFPPTRPSVGAPRSPMSQRPAGTLVMASPQVDLIRMGDTNYAYKITMRMGYYPNGANSFFRHDRSLRPGRAGLQPGPAGRRGRPVRLGGLQHRLHVPVRAPPCRASSPASTPAT